MHSHSWAPWTKKMAFHVVAAMALLCASGAHADWQKIKDSGVLKVAVYKDFAPFSDIVQGNPTGIDVQIAQALADKLGLKLSLLPFDAGENMEDDLRNMVWKGHYLGYGPANVMMHAPVDKVFMRKNDNALIFGQYYRETVVMLRDLRKIKTLTSVEELQGQALAAERGSVAASALLGAAEGSLKDKLSIVSSTAQAVDMLLKGQVAAVYGTRAQLEGALKANRIALGDSYAISSLSLRGVPDKGWVSGMAVKEEERDLAKAIETALSSLDADGTIKAIFEKAGVAWVQPNQ